MGKKGIMTRLPIGNFFSILHSPFSSMLSDISVASVSTHRTTASPLFLGGLEDELVDGLARGNHGKDFLVDIEDALEDGGRALG